MFVANQALLRYTSYEENSAHLKFRGKVMWSSPGEEVRKPVLPVSAMVVISILLVVQLVGIAYALFFMTGTAQTVRQPGTAMLMDMRSK